MGRFLLGLVLGIALVFVGQELVHGDFWRYSGRLDGRSEVFEYVQREFGVLDASAREIPNAAHLSHKASLLVAVEVNGVKTIRVIP